MRFTVNIGIDNDAFVHAGQENPFGDSTGTEVARILHVLAERVERGGVDRDEDDPYVLRDANGSTVGLAYYSEEDGR